MVMYKKNKFYENFTWCLSAGLCLTGISVLLFCILGKDSIVTYHDQLDGEVLCYIYHAKYLFKDSLINELMNGMPKTSLTPPAPLFVLFYRILPPFAAFVVSQYFTMLLGFLGIYLLLTAWKVNPLPAALSGILFAYLPLLPVYGLSMYGIPLVLWAFISLAERRRTFLAMGIIVLFGLSSSLVLSGFAVLGVLILLGLLWCTARKNKFYLTGVGALVLVYILTNLPLFAQMLSADTNNVSHKEELVIAAAPFMDSFMSILINGAEHAVSYQKWILILALIIIIAGVCKKEWRDSQWKLICMLFGAAVVIALLCALYTTGPIVELRRSIGGVAVWFQLDRIYWLYPALWYALMGLALQWLWQLRKWLCLSIGLTVYVITAVTVLFAGNWKDNVQKIINHDTSDISWNDFYA